MTQQRQPTAPIFHIDVSPNSPAQPETRPSADDGEMASLLRRLVAGQEKQNKLLEGLVGQLSSAQRQRATELGQWKQANPKLARGCRMAAEMLGGVQTAFLQKLIDDVGDNADALMDGEFMLNEFVDRYGPRLAHLNGVLQVLSQLSSVPNPANSAQ